MPKLPMLKAAGFNQLVEGREGYFLYNKNDVYIGQAIEKYGEFSGLEFDLLKQLCNPGDIVFDIGANIGSHTVGLARRVGPEGRVLAFEPQRMVHQVLCANVALNSLTNVYCYLAALGVSAGQIAVPELDPESRNNFGGLSLLGNIPGETVECMTLDHFVDLPRVRLIKIDVEGMEAQVLEGGRRLIDKFKPLLYVENDRLDKSEALIRCIAGMGYRLYWHLPPLYNPANFFGVAENLYPNTVSVNMLCIHRDEQASLEGFDEVKDFTAHPLRR